MADLTQDDDLPGMLMVLKGVQAQEWPHTMDAMIWAQEFAKRVDFAATNGVSVTHDRAEIVEMMLPWFANAIMAGYDTANQRAQSAAPAV